MSRWALAIAAILAFTLAAFVAHKLRPRADVDAVVSDIKNSIDASQERTDKIVSETRTKEVAARAESRKAAALLSDDELLNAINEMLREYRQSLKN